jgi:hypothetical protein
MIYSITKQGLKHNSLSWQNLNVSYFIQAIEHERKMHARFQDLILPRFL